MLQNIRIVLVETSHTGNMGSVARAMKTMGLTNLWLVNPLVKPDSQAIALAAGASDVIGNAHIVDTLDEALAGCSLVVGTSGEAYITQGDSMDQPDETLLSPGQVAGRCVAALPGAGVLLQGLSSPWGTLCLGALWLLVRRLRARQALMRLVRSARPAAGEDVAHMLLYCRDLLGLKRQVEIRTSAAVRSPEAATSLAEPAVSRVGTRFQSRWASRYFSHCISPCG